MSVHVRQVRFFRLPMRTRFPFRYGIASLTELPHLFVKVDVEIDGRISTGMSADGLPPKWFTKNPNTTFNDDDLPAMLRVIRHAADSSLSIGKCSTFFGWWHELHEAQISWAKSESIPPLLSGFGFSLMERAVMDVFCRTNDITFFDAMRTNAFDVDLAALRSELRGVLPVDVLPAEPRGDVAVRHTVGLGDPLQDEDIPDEERIDDGLPHSLVANIRAYGLRFFKIKLSGDADADRDRLERIAAILDAEVDEPKLTLDGNENFSTIASFRDQWEALRRQPSIKRLFDHALMFVEQPVHRDSALTDDVRRELSEWKDAPPIIIDESDADLSCFPRALELGYSGTSHKNCKGVLKGLSQLAIVARRRDHGSDSVLSAEDLANVGPVALLQDLAVVAALGVGHVERNGHHYFAGLSMLPEAEQKRTLANHSDLYASSDGGFPSLLIKDGNLRLNSVNASPFGVAEHPDVAAFAEWDLQDLV